MHTGYPKHQPYIRSKPSLVRPYASVKNPTAKVLIPTDLYNEARTLCGLSHAEVVEYVTNDGIRGLRNFVAHTENWIGPLVG